MCGDGEIGVVGVTDGLGDMGRLREEGAKADRSFRSNLAWDRCYQTFYGRNLLIFVVS